MNPHEQPYAYLIDDLPVDVSGHWTKWGWDQVNPWTSYEHARLEEYRDSVVVAYRLYNRIGLEHARRMLADAPHDARILDAGGGTGRKAIPLAQDGFTNITVLDVAPGWLRLADEQARAAGVRGRLTLLEGDVRHMHEFPDSSFDYVLALGGVVSYCGDPASAIGEMARVLRPGAKLLADGIHGQLGSLHLLARMGNLEALEKLSRGDSPRTPAVLPEDLIAFAHQARLTEVRVWSEFAFAPDDGIRVGSDTEHWERLVLELEMRYCDDPRFLGAGMLLLRATKGISG